MKAVKVALAAVAALGTLAGAGAEFNVSPGDDLVAVRDRIRAARASGAIASNESVTVTLAPGDYRLAKTLLLEAKDSGTAKAPVVWRAERPRTVRILGGSVIPKTAFHTLSLEASRRVDPKVAGKVLEADVSKLLLREPKPWADGPRDSLLQGPWLYVGGESQQLARWPNADAPDGGWHYWTNVLESCGYEVDKRTKKPAVVEFVGDRAERWRFDEGVWFLGYFVVDWNCDLQRIASYDKATHAAKFANYRTNYGVGKGGWPFGRRRFYAINLLEELDQPGEWYFDRRRKKVFWYPGKDSGEIVLAQDLVPFVRLEKAHDVRLENLFFGYAHGDAPAVAMANARDCAVTNCDFECLSALCVDVVGSRNRVSDCRMSKLGSSVARLVGGDRRNLLPANNLIERCTVTRNGLYKRSGSKAFGLSGCGNAIRDSKVSQAPEGAVNYDGNEHLIADNDFGHIVLEVGDAGAIYSGHHSDWLGTVIFGNYIHHLAKTPLEEGARCAIYFDDCDWGDDSIGNTLVHCGLGFEIGGGKLHGVYNNLIAECARGVSIDGRGNGWRTSKSSGSFWWSLSGRTFAQRRHDEAKIDPDAAPWCVAYPALREAMDNRPEYPLMNEVEGNVFRNCKSPLAGWGVPRGMIDPKLPGNTFLTNSADASISAPQPIRLKDAVANVLKSADGRTVARFALDASAHFCWTLEVGGRPVLAPSPLGITVGYFDCGHRVVPGLAEDRGEVSVASFTNGTVQSTFPRDGDVAARNAATNLAAFASLAAREWSIPVRNLITGGTVAHLEVRVWNGGAAYRWTLRGESARKIFGENDAFLPASGRRDSIVPVEWGRDRNLANGYPEVLFYPRGPGWGVAFPEFPHGWTHKGPIATPWRSVLFAK